jgi:hypothetical protein
MIGKGDVMSIASGQMPTAVAATPSRPGRSIHQCALGIALSALVLLVLPQARALSELAGAAAAELAPAGVLASSPAEEQPALAAYGNLPVTFVPNAGQTDPRVRYYAQGPGYGFFFARDHAVLSFRGSESGAVLRLRFLGANSGAEVTAGRKGTAKVNYLIGRDPAKWQTGLPVYGEVVYRELWPGVDAVFRGEGGKLKYEFHVMPGARVGQIALAYGGAQRLSLNKAGDLLIRTKLGTLKDAAPVSYQVLDGKRSQVASRYVVKGGNRYGFALGAAYDPRRPLVIDPALVYSTFLGGTGGEAGQGIAVDRSGNTYVSGNTTSLDFPTTPGAFDTTYNGSTDVFVSKLTADGSALVYSTYLGGTNFDFGSDRGGGIEVDSRGYAYVTGRTNSANFPTTPGAFDNTLGGSSDAFVTKLSPDGSTLVYSTLLGSSGFDPAWELALDQGGHAYVTGETGMADFPTTPGAFDTTFNGCIDAFVTKLNPEGSALVYSTFLGATGCDSGAGIAVDAKDHAYVTGRTNSPNYPTTLGAFDNTLGSVDAFVTKLTADGSALVYSTFLGGSFFDEGFGIDVDNGNAYVGGDVNSSDFPTTPNAFDVTLNASTNGFITKFNDDGSALVYSTFLGGTFFDTLRGIAVDSAGHAYVVGSAASHNFPTTHDAFDRTVGGVLSGTGSDGYLTKFSVDGSTLEYSTYLGGSGADSSLDVAVDSSEHAYLTGLTQSRNDFPTTPGAFDRVMGGTSDAFVTQFETKVAAHLGGGGN